MVILTVIAKISNKTTQALVVHYKVLHLENSWIDALSVTVFFIYNKYERIIHKSVKPQLYV